MVSNYSVMGFVGEYLWSEELVGTSKYKLFAAFEEIDELGHCLLVGFGAPGYGFLPKQKQPLVLAQPAHPAHQPLLPSSLLPYHSPTGEDGAEEIVALIKEILLGDNIGIYCAAYKVPWGFSVSVTCEIRLRSLRLENTMLSVCNDIRGRCLFFA